MRLFVVFHGVTYDQFYDAYFIDTCTCRMQPRRHNGRNERVYIVYYHAFSAHAFVRLSLTFV